MTAQRSIPDPLTEAQLAEMASLLHAFISAPTFNEKEQLVHNSPILLRQEADSALAGLMMQYADEDDIQQALRLHRALLQRCHETGIEEAFHEFRQMFQMQPGAESFDEMREQALVQTIGEFVTAENWDAARAILETNPVLLSQQTQAVIAQLINNHTARNETRVVHALVIHRDLLRACKEMGVEAAFERMANPPSTLDMLAENTTAVLTNRADELSTWQETIRLARIRAAEDDNAPMLTLLQAISSLLDDTPPEDVAPALENEYAACWQRIVDSISGT